MPVHPTVARRLFYRHRHRVTSAAAMLAGVAGFVNGVAFELTDRPVSHHTGTVTRLGRDLADHQPLDLTSILPIVVGFFVGAMLSGMIVGTRYLLPRRRYGAVLMLEGTLLAVSGLLFVGQPLAAVVIAAVACGLQNGMANSFYGVVVRTTHVSGLLTDLAVLTGHRLHGRPVEGWRAAFQSSIIASFLVGGFLGALAARHGGPLVLEAPAAVCLLGGVTYATLITRQRNIRLARRAARRHHRGTP